MATIDLKYGKDAIAFDHDGSQFEILRAAETGRRMTDVEIGERLDNPLGSHQLEEIVKPGDSVLLVVPDATRQTAAGQVVNLVVRRLIANGTPAHDIRIIFATGIHRKVTEAEKAAILTPFIAQRIKALDHDARNLMQLVGLGATTGGIEIELNRSLAEHDHVVIIGGVSFHYFAGFTGGRKLICPGLASARTISETHKLAFDLERKARRDGVDTGLLEGNAVHEAFVEVVEKRPPRFAINTIVNDAGDAIDLYCGDWQASHRSACDAYAVGHSIDIPERRELVIASCGGYPHDINLIQAHKALDAASRACRDRGTIFLLAECSEGTGRDDFLKWFDAGTSKALAEKLCAKYQVNGQTAWSLLEKAEKFDIRVVTNLDEAATSALRMAKTSVSGMSDQLAKTKKPGYILPSAAKLLIRVADDS